MDSEQPSCVASFPSNSTRRSFHSFPSLSSSPRSLAGFCGIRQNRQDFHRIVYGRIPHVNPILRQQSAVTLPRKLSHHSGGPTTLEDRRKYAVTCILLQRRTRSHVDNKIAKVRRLTEAVGLEGIVRKGDLTASNCILASTETTPTCGPCMSGRSWTR